MVELACLENKCAFGHRGFESPSLRQKLQRGEANMTIFQKIINGEIPAHKIYEDNKTLAFLDIYPVMPGHTLVIPKNPIEFVWDLPEDDYRVLMSVSKKIALHLREKLPQQYVHMAVVGLDVPHAHVHLIPFDQTADFRKPSRTDVDPDHEALAKKAELLRIL